jgi:hypothetical protein
MTETSNESTEHSSDTTNVLNALSTNDGTLSLTINIDKSTAAKFAWWAILLIVLMVLFLGANAAFLFVSAREDRLLALAVDERRIENRQAWRALGVDGLALEDHDISVIIDDYLKKHPPKQKELPK